ncbi:hypothetical protein SERLA73DRAFT_70756 [Serpula lacrymans var. lacrymans S7.3]|uniref:Uncharacterized protein n=2 Tax=Serpula lacrymans var. lacrymans TaxID=341189 RepID=F8PQG8_SERL3|nr:uncharacterized protein SERLADRAFT_406403 [Serpula lacrymans var. lacrymans S7.9]EGO01581.1 hypothetical protein SERLA73DRAFT_70756 [Serpula lacrymans var. lacrymans S7.3]EGO27240.1 hypothetical protein SERLADRAFT_406403 [Serpula lacrymans var. lacrymans S7.9]
MASTAGPLDPKAVKQMEKIIEKEGKGEEKDFQHALKDLHATEKSESKASKAAYKAEKTLKKTEKKEQSAMKSLQKATHAHDMAVTNLHSAQTDAQVKQQQDVKLKQALEAKVTRVNEISKQKEIHNHERESRLSQIHERPNQAVGTSLGIPAPNASDVPGAH